MVENRTSRGYGHIVLPRRAGLSATLTPRRDPTITSVAVSCWVSVFNESLRIDLRADAFRAHLFKVPVAQLLGKMPAAMEHDELALETMLILMRMLHQTQRRLMLQRRFRA